MSSSVKLHIIAALDQSTRLKEGLDWLLGRHHVQVTAAHSDGSLSRATPARSESTSGESDGLKRDVKTESPDELQTASAAAVAMETSEPSDGGEQACPTGYQRLLEIMITKQVRCIAFCLACHTLYFSIIHCPAGM